MRTPIRLGLVASFVLLVACDSSDDPNTDPVDAPETLGTFAVGYQTFAAVDAARDDRTLRVDLWYPVDEADAADSPRAMYVLQEPFSLESDVAVEGLPVSARPGQTLLVFSHGYGGTNTQSTPLMETLASHGFIVASPEHTGNAVGSNPPDDRDTAAANRVPDISFVIDAMLERSATPGDPFEGRIAPEVVGVLGHSFGGTTSLGVAAGFAGGAIDPRVGAIAPISGGVENTFSDEQLTGIEIPALLLGGTLDEAVPIENNAYAFERMTSAAALYKVDIIGATHTHFANVCSIGGLLIGLGIEQSAWPGVGAGALVDPYNDTCAPDVFPIDEAVRLQNLYVVSFFKRHLLGERGYDEYLSPTYAEDNEPAIDFSSR